MADIDNDGLLTQPLLQARNAFRTWCTLKCARRFLKQVFPFLTILTDYSLRYDLPCDLIGGLTVGIMHIPQGMAYALLASLPPVYGLYTSFFPPIFYFFFGSSRHISVGTFAVVSLMVGTVVDQGQSSWYEQTSPSTEPPVYNSSSDIVQHYNDSEARSLSELEHIKVSYAMSVTFAVGVWQASFGLVRLGFLASFMSDSLISGFTTGAAVHVFCSQLHSIFGIHVGRYSGSFKLIYGFRDLLVNMHEVNLITMAVSFSAIVSLVLVREGINNNKKHCSRLRVPVPVELLLIVGGTLLSYCLKLHEEFQVSVIGEIPRGLPSVDVTLLYCLPEVLTDAIPIALTAFVVSFAVAKILADKNNYAVDANQELFAHGISNLMGSLFSAFTSSASLSRSLVQEDVGGKTQMSSLFSTLIVLLVLLFVGPLFQTLPNGILAAIILVSLKKMLLQFSDLKRLWKISAIDFTVWLVVFTSTVLLDVYVGLMIGFVFSLLPVLLRIQRPYVCLLGNLKRTEAYVDMNIYKEACEVPGVKIFHFGASLHFVNADYFKRSLALETGLNVKILRDRPLTAKEGEAGTTKMEKETNLCDTMTPWKGGRHSDYQSMSQRSNTSFSIEGAPIDVVAIIVDGSTLQYIDSATIRILTEVIQTYKDIGVDVLLGGCKPSVSAMLESAGFYDHVPRQHMCDTIHKAVHLALKTHETRCQSKALASLEKAMNQRLDLLLSVDGNSCGFIKEGVSNESFVSYNFYLCVAARKIV